MNKDYLESLITANSARKLSYTSWSMLLGISFLSLSKSMAKITRPHFASGLWGYLMGLLAVLPIRNLGLDLMVRQAVLAGSL